MKIIKYGSYIQNEGKEVQCVRCESILLYTKNDIQASRGDWCRTGVESSERDVIEYILCPVCGHFITLSTYVEEY